VDRVFELHALWYSYSIVVEDLSLQFVIAFENGYDPDIMAKKSPQKHDFSPPPQNRRADH
jgi:hypothetical protein